MVLGEGHSEVEGVQREPEKRFHIIFQKQMKSVLQLTF